VDAGEMAVVANGAKSGPGMAGAGGGGAGLVAGVAVAVVGGGGADVVVAGTVDDVVASVTVVEDPSAAFPAASDPSPLEHPPAATAHSTRPTIRFPRMRRAYRGHSRRSRTAGHLAAEGA
jgi:hypothetical protein